MPRILPAVAILCVVLTLACGDDDASGGDTSGPATIATATATLDGSNEKPTEAPTPEPGQIGVANEPISVETADGVVLKGHLYSRDGPKRQALIIVAPVDQSTWAEGTQAFTSEGIAVFTFDPRGFGETGGDEAPDKLTSDASLVTRFVMSREYPLVYLMGVGLDGGAAVSDAAGSLDELSGVVTYGGAGGPETPNRLSLGGDATWDGEDVLAIPAVRDRVLSFVLAGN